MKIVQTLASLLAIATTLVACTSEVDSHPTLSTADNEVSLSLPVETTRTSIESDGRNTRWVPGDKLAVWAMDANGEYVFSNALFSMRHYSAEYDLAFFSGNVAEMAKGDYTYLLSYPYPQSVEGTKATYRVSATQSGNYDGKYDIMVAEPVVAKALSAKERVELNTVTKHQMHALKINVPEGRNLYGDRFYRLEITFPSDVVGDITVDVSDPNAEPTYTNTSNVIVVEREEGFDVGDDIWVFVLPGTVEGDVTYRVRGERRHSEYTTFPMSRTLERGHVTPVRMMIPVVYPYYTEVTFSVDKNNLGEDFNYFDVYDGETFMGKFERNASNKYIVSYEGELDADVYDNKTIRLVFDSNNAIVETSVNLGDVTAYTSKSYSVTVPYIFTEDFSTLQGYNGDYDAGPYTSVDGATTAAKDLSQYGIPSGWTGARTGCDAEGSAILVGGRVDCVILGATRAYGRLDSPAMSKIKPGKQVNVKVSFTYSGSRSGSSTYYPVGRCGYTTIPDAINGYATQFDNNEAFKDIDGAVTIPNIPTNGSAAAATAEMTYTIADCTSEHRLSWHVGHMGYKNWKIDNGNGWMYVDNIKVQIVK